MSIPPQKLLTVVSKYKKCINHSFSINMYYLRYKAIYIIFTVIMTLHWSLMLIYCMNTRPCNDNGSLIILNRK